MKSTLAALAVLAALLAAPALARAEGYYLGLGTGVTAREEGHEGAGRVMLGRRWSNDFALEAAYFGSDPVAVGGSSWSNEAFGLDLKYHLPLLLGFELYVKGGVHLDRIHGLSDDASGRGYDYGVGLLWALRALQVVEAGVWLDASKQITTYEIGGASVEADSTAVLIGISIGTGI